MGSNGTLKTSDSLLAGLSEAFLKLLLALLSTLAMIRLLILKQPVKLRVLIFGHFVSRLIIEGVLILEQFLRHKEVSSGQRLPKSHKWCATNPFFLNIYYGFNTYQSCQFHDLLTSGFPLFVLIQHILRMDRYSDSGAYSARSQAQDPHWCGTSRSCSLWDLKAVVLYYQYWLAFHYSVVVVVELLASFVDYWILNEWIWQNHFVLVSFLPALIQFLS